MGDDKMLPTTTIPPDYSLPALPGESSIVDGEILNSHRVKLRRPHRTSWLIKFVIFTVRIGAAVAIAWFFYLIPVGVFPTPFQNWKNPIVIFFLICYVGKTLYDTFFFDHYQP